MAKQKRKTIAILGGGITGLVSAYYLSKDYNIILIENGKRLGGSAAGFIYKDFILDYGPHKIYTELPGIIEEIAKICPLNKVPKKNSIYLNNNYFDFPLKISQVATHMPFTAFNAGIDILLKPLSHKPDDSYENFLINRFGPTLYNLSFRDYAFKVWNSNPKELDAELAKRRVAISGIFQLIKGVLFKDTKKISAESFYYPPLGIKQLIDSLYQKLIENKCKIMINTEVYEINVKNNRAKYLKIKNKKVNFDYLISTIHLDSFASLIKAKNISEDISKLKYQKLSIVYFILNKERALKDCWVFFPERKFMFQRVSEQKAFSNQLGPKNKTVLMVETTKELNNNIINEMIAQLEHTKILSKGEIEEYFIKSYGKAYPVYLKGFVNPLNNVLNAIEAIDNVYTIGRPGLFNYNNMDQCWDMAMKTASHIKSNSPKESWKEIKKQFDNYRIVD